MQSKIFYDPQNLLTQAREGCRIVFCPCKRSTLAGLADTAGSVFLKPDPQEPVLQASEKSSEAVSAVSGAQPTGTILDKKPDVLAFYRRHLPDAYRLVEELYLWKTDAVVRTEVVEAYATEQQQSTDYFRNYMPRLERIVRKVVSAY